MNQYVIIQVEAFVPKPLKQPDGSTRLSRKRYRQWVNVGRARVLYHDQQVIFVRQFGSHGHYSGDGSPRSVGWTHKKFTFRYRCLDWRIHPDSVKRLRSK